MCDSAVFKYSLNFSSSLPLFFFFYCCLSLFLPKLRSNLLLICPPQPPDAHIHTHTASRRAKQTCRESESTTRTHTYTRAGGQNKPAERLTEHAHTHFLKLCVREGTLGSAWIPSGCPVCPFLFAPLGSFGQFVRRGGFSLRQHSFQCRGATSINNRLQIYLQDLASDATAAVHVGYNLTSLISF